MNIAAYAASELKIEILPPEQPIPLHDLDGAQGAQVRVYTKDEYTGSIPCSPRSRPRPQSWR